MTEAVTEAAGTKATVIAAEAMQGDVNNPNAGIGGSVVLGETTTYSMTITRPSTGTKVEIADTAKAKDDDPKFMQAMDLGDGRTMHVRDERDDMGEGVEEVVFVSTDIEAPKATPFAMVAGQELNADEDGGVETGDDAVARDLGDALESRVDAEAAVLSKMMSDEFTAAAGTSVEHTFDAAVEDNANTADVDESMDAAEVAGSYNGAPGTYKCTGTTDCSVTVDAEGKLTAASDGWIFTPDMGATSDVQDADYLHYGFWLKRTTTDGATTYNEVETFAVSSVDASGSVSAVEGTASYDGNAVGVYVKNVFDSDGEIDTATSGHFKADVSLMAYFGGLDVAASKANTVTGTIDNFQLSGEEENAWSVALKGDITDGTVEDGTANGGGAEGSFSATFHGSVTAVDHDMDNTTPEVVPAPSSVVGEFNANFVNGTVAGGFGAREMKEE